MLLRRTDCLAAIALLVVWLAAFLPVIGGATLGCRAPAPAESGADASTPGGTGGPTAPGAAQARGQVHISVTDLRADAEYRNYEWDGGAAEGPFIHYPVFDVSPGGSVVVGQGSVIVKLFITDPVLPADVDKALSVGGAATTRSEWTEDSEWWSSLGPDGGETPYEFLHGKSFELTYAADEPGPFTVAIAGSLPLGGDTTLGEDLVVTVTRGNELVVSIEGVEKPHITVPASAVVGSGHEARRFTVSPGTWHFRATFSEPMAEAVTSPDSRLPDDLLEVRRDLRQGSVGLTAEWEDPTHLLMTVEASPDARGLFAVFFDGLEAVSGGRVGAQGGLDLEFTPPLVLSGRLLGTEPAAAVELPLPVFATSGAVAPDGRHAVVWEETHMADAEITYDMSYPWLVDLETGKTHLVGLCDRLQTAYAGWRDSQTVFLSYYDGLQRLDINAGEPEETAADGMLAAAAVPLPGDDLFLNGFGISADGKTIALAEGYHRLLFVDTGSLSVTAEAEVDFPEDLFYIPSSETGWSLPITWIPGRQAIALERIRDAVQLVFSVPSGQPVKPVFAGPGGRNIARVIAWSPDGNTALAADPGLCIVTGTAETPLASEWQFHDQPWRGLPPGAFSPSGDYLAVAYDGKVYVYRVATGDLADTLDGWLLNWSAGEDRVWVIRPAG